MSRDRPITNRARAALRAELRPMLSLAVPLVLGELAWMAMGVVDTMMVGRVSAEALGAMGIGRSLLFVVAVFGIGLLLGLDTLVSQAFGAGDREGAVASLVQGCWLSLALAPLLTGVFAGTYSLLDVFGVDPAVRPATLGYMKGVGGSLLPVMLYTAFRRYLQSVNLVRPIMLALVSANLVNVVTNWILIFGNLGAPALGAAGAGWATTISTVYMAGFLAFTTVLSLRGRDAPRVRWRLDPARLRRLVGLGLPAALQITVEVGVFALATVLAGRFAPAALAAHQIALTLASVTFMVPFGVSSAGAVRVGQAVGRRAPRDAGRAGWTALLLSVAFMTLAALAFVVLPRPLVRLFSTDPEVVAVGGALLLIAAMFQLFDGIQVTATGALRGAGDTRTPLALNLIGHWALGLPVGWLLGFRLGLGVVGLWVGLSVGLIVVASVLIVVWARRVRSLRAELAPGHQGSSDR